MCLFVLTERFNKQLESFFCHFAARQVAIHILVAAGEKINSHSKSNSISLDTEEI